MNNKGFAITTILYGVMILFCLLLVSLLGILSSYKKTRDILTDSNKGTRKIVSYNTYYQSEINETLSEGRIIYCTAPDKCCYRRVTLAIGIYSFPVISDCVFY